MSSLDNENKVPLELPEPEEKLLRSPNFFEKYTWIKPVSLIFILIVTIILSFFYLSQTENQSTENPKLTIKPTAVTQPTKIPEINNWKTYVSVLGKYEIRYPNEYLFKEDNVNNSIELLSNILPETKTNFRLSIAYKPTNNLSLLQLITQNKICNRITPAKGTPSTINGITLAQLYLDTPCGSYPTTVIYTINNNNFYTILIETQSNYSTVKQYTDKVLATLKFTEQTNETTPKLSCTPRPACLNNEPPCLIPETSQFCPAVTPSPK